MRSPRTAPASDSRQAVRQSLMLTLEPEDAVADEPEDEPEEVEPEESVVIDDERSHDAPSREPWASPAAHDWRSPEAGVAAAMTPSAPRLAIPEQATLSAWAAIPGQPSPRPYAPGRAAPAASLDSSPRTSVAPVVASLPPMTGAPRLAPPRGRLSADSKLLAAGGALAAAMLLVATGVLLGQRSAAMSAAPGAATGPYPVVVDTKAPAAAAALPAAATVEARPALSAAVVEKLDGPATIDVLQLPTAPRPRPQGWSVVPTPKAPAATAGWTVANPTPAHPAAPVAIDPAAAPRAAAVPEPEDPIATAAAGVPEPSAAPPPVDPLVQAVREDIREDESRAK